MITRPLSFGFFEQKPFVPKISPPTPTFIDKVCTIARPYLLSAPALFFGLQGLHEVFFANSQEDVELKDRIDVCRKNALPSKQYLLMHGTTFVGASVCFGLEAMQVGRSVAPLSTLGNSFFLFASILAIEENIRLYEHAREIDKDPTIKDKPNTFWLKQSAVWGILSNLGYIAFSVFSIFNFAPATALLIGVISAFCGALKILADFIDWLKQR